MKKNRRPYDMTARAAHAEATRQRIRLTAMQLYCERPIEDFTLEDVATRAGTTVQTVLRAYGSKDNLILEALDELAAGGASLRATPPGEIGPAVGAICDVYDAIGDLVIQRLNDERRRPGLKPALDQGRENHRDWVRTVFAPQLACRTGASRAELFNILAVATDVLVWKILRRDQNLSRPQAEAVIRRLITSATEEEKADGKDSLAELVGRRQSAS
jgi:AcrR family transcriptional regulator